MKHFLPTVHRADGLEMMTQDQNIKTAVVAYTAVICYTALLILEIHNLFKYIFLKRKYEVFPLSLFYMCSIPMAILRIVESIWIIQFMAYQNNWMQLTPPVVKINVALTQILVMTELTIRVEQSQINVTELYVRFLNNVVIA